MFCLVVMVACLSHLMHRSRKRMGELTVSFGQSVCGLYYIHSPGSTWEQLPSIPPPMRWEDSGVPSWVGFLTVHKILSAQHSLKQYLNIAKHIISTFEIPKATSYLTSYVYLETCKGPCKAANTNFWCFLKLSSRQSFMCPIQSVAFVPSLSWHQRSCPLSMNNLYGMQKK